MKRILKNVLSKLILVLLFLTTISASLHAKRGASDYHFHYDTGRNHPFYVQPPQVPQYIPPLPTFGFHHNPNYYYPVRSTHDQAAPVFMATRPPTDTEKKLLAFTPEYLAVFASRLEKPSGASFEQMIANRNDLITRAGQIAHDISLKMVAAKGPTKHIIRTQYQELLNKLTHAVQILSNERTVLVNEEHTAHTVSFQTHSTLFNQKNRFSMH